MRKISVYTCPVCSPKRAGLMTGVYPIRFGMQRAVNRPFSKIGFPENMTTLPEALQKAGYKYRHAVGKWHLGNMKKSHLPMSQGFTSQYGPYCSGIDYFQHTRGGVHDFHRNETTIHKEGYYTDMLSDEAVNVIERHEDESPFFIYLPYGAPHLPLQAPKTEIERYKNLGRRAKYAAMVSIIDQGVGRILDALDKKKVSDNTLIIFMSDNGGIGVASNEPLRGRKGTLYEGGIRVLAVARWPKRIPSGSTCDKLCLYIDVYHTLLDAAGCLSDEKAKEFDGRSLLSLWGAKNGKVEDKDFFSFFETYRLGEELSVIEGNWKLIRRGPSILDTEQAKKAKLQLYRLDKDIKEQTNLADEYPGRVAAMLKKLVAFRKLRPEKGGVPPMTEPTPKGFKPPTNWDPQE